MAETELQSLVDLNKQIEEVRLNSRLQAELRTRHFEEQKLHSQYLEKQLLEMKEILISMAVRDRGQTSSSKNPAQNSPSTLVSQLHSTMNPPLTDPFRSGQLTANRNQQVASGESSRFELKDDPISTKEPSDRIAHQVLDKMPELFADKINLEIAHVSSIEELHGLEAFGNDVREQVVWALGNNAGDSPQCRDLARQGGELMPHLTQINEHTDLINLPSVLETKEIVTNYIDELCFDPGGEEILYAFDSLDWCRVDIKLSDVPAMTNDDCLLGKRVRNREVLNQVEESAQVRIKEEPNIVKERSDLTAHQVLDEMPKSIVDELDFKITLGSLAEELDDMKDFEVSDLNHVTSLSLVENMAADLVRFLRKPPNQEEIVMDYIGVLCFDPGGNFVGVLLERHTVDYDLSCNCCLNPIEWVNWVAYMLRAHTTEDVVKCELLKCFDMKGCLISIFLDNKILSDKHSSYFVTTFLSSKWVGNSVTSKEVWKSLAKRYLMIVDNKEFASDKYWKYDMGTTLWCWETHDYLFHFANSLVNLEPSSSKEKNGDATQGLEGSDVESVSDTIDMENSYADVGSLFGIAPKTCFSIMHLGEGHYSVALYCRRNHQIPENTSYLEVAPALAADCAAILKHSELASLTCLELGQVCKDVGLPAGVLNILTSLGPEVGAPLASHPVVDKIAFTGSNATGSKIMSSASQVVKPVTMELGGKSPIIVFEDVDLDKAAEWTAFGCFWTNGQICSATSRLIVHENIAAAFLERLVEWVKNIKVCDPFEEDCKLGPVISQGQYEKILKFITTAKSEGATVLCGGSRPEHVKRGYFIQPTIVSDVTTSMQIWREEIFGPVLCVKTFSSEAEAIELANDSPYGLAGAVISKDLERCERMTKALQVGMVWVNCSQPCFCQVPWGGTKRSGFGRELGEWGIENYLNIKQVTEYTSDEPWGWYKSPSKL